MAKRIDDLVALFKARISELFEVVDRDGLSAARLSKFERSLFDQLGELGRSIETVLLEQSDVDVPSIEVDGKRHYRKYRGPEEYQGFLGKMTVKRTIYQANYPGARTVCPLERNAGILHHNMTPLAAEFTSYATALTVPEEVHEFCRRWHFLRPSSTVIKQVASEVGKQTELLPELHEAQIHRSEPVDARTKSVVVSRDGTMVQLRGEGWRQAEVASVSLYNKDGERSKSTYVATIPGGGRESSSDKLNREIEAVAEKLPDAKFAYICDGALANWKYQEQHPRLKNATGILDFWHVMDKLYAGVDALFGEGNIEGKKWLEQQRCKLLELDRGAERVLQSLRNQRSRRAVRSAERRTVIRDVERYIHRNRARMRYAKYLRQGLPIGSGVVEAACKVVVGQRLKRSGMRWSPEGGQHILNLRTLVMSRRWDAFWNAHENVLNLIRVAA